MCIYRGRSSKLEPAPPARWLQGLAALIGLVLVIIGAGFEFRYSPAAAFVAMGVGYFLANFLIALFKPLPFYEKMTLIVAMHFCQFCLILAAAINGLLPFTILTFTCSLAGVALASKLVNAGKSGASSQIVS